MGKFIKKNSGFLYWVLLPSLLLVASVFGVNFISRPAVSLYGSFGIGTGCSTDPECNAVTNNCVVEYCNTIDGTTNYCDISVYDTNGGGNCPNCNVCGNGRCEPGAPSPEDSITCTLDCLKSAGETSARTAVCETTQCGAELFIISTNFTNSTALPPAFDGCCPIGCQGVNSADSLTFDPDCCTQCGDGVVDSLTGETCDTSATAQGVTCLQACRAPGLAAPNPGQCTCCGDGIIDSNAGEQCEPSLNNGTCTTPATGAPGTCDNQCQCVANCGNGVVDAGEQCEPPNTATCDANCQTIPPTCGNNIIDPGETCDPPNGTTCGANCQLIPQAVCGNGIVEAGEQCEGTTCSVTDTDGTIIPGVCQNCQCIPQCDIEGSGCGDTANTPGPCFIGSGGVGVGSSLIPPPVHPTVLAQWIATFALPGATFVGLRARRKSKK